MRGTLYFYKTITKYSKIHFSKFTAVISQFINAKTSFFFSLYKLQAPSSWAHRYVRFSKILFSNKFFEVKNNRVLPVCQKKKKKSVYVCINSLGFQEHDQSGRFKANTNHEGSTEDSCYIGK